MRIGELASLTGVTPSKVRFYEAEGLLPRPARRESGYRDYDDEAVVTLSLINGGRRLGYTLREIASYLGIPDEFARRSMLLRCIDGKLADFDALMAETESRRIALQVLKQKLAARPG